MCSSDLKIYRQSDSVDSFFSCTHAPLLCRTGQRFAFQVFFRRKISSGRCVDTDFSIKTAGVRCSERTAYIPVNIGYFLVFSKKVHKQAKNV